MIKNITFDIDSRGFASMDPDKQKKIASAGGKARMKNMDKEGRKRLASQGGKARMKLMSEKERKKFASQGGKASHGKK